MATVVITFFLLVSLYVCKMDADYQDRRRDHTTSRREKRWSMYSQRLEEIVAELMKPISDIRRSFDTDLSALLEEYLTEAGLHALSASEEGEHCAPVAPNFAELALLLQHSASLYGRKVDFLYQHVLNVSDSLHNTTQEREPANDASEPGDAAGQSARRRRRQSGAPGAGPGRFAEVEVEPAAGGARRGPEPARPPPTLPRIYIELEPRVLADTDLQLYDYAGEPIGLPADFYVTWRLQGGLLLDELQGTRPQEEAVLRPISLVELQAAIEAGAPPSPGPLDSPGDEMLSPAGASTPLPRAPPPPGPPPPGPPPPDLTLVLKKERKRRSDTDVDDILKGCFTKFIDAAVRRKLRRVREFGIRPEWIESVVSRRKSVVVAQRRRVRSHATHPPHPPHPPHSPHPPGALEVKDFQGFDFSLADIGGFTGWSRAEAEAALAVVAGATSSGSSGRAEPDSEDDGFFEQSSLGDSDDTPLNHSISITATSGSGSGTGPCLSWQERVAARALAAEARGGLDVTELARAVLDACSPGCDTVSTSTGSASTSTAFTDVLRVAAAEEKDLSRLLLTTLFLANAGNVEIVRGEPLSVDTFAVRVLSRDARLYRGLADAADTTDVADVSPAVPARE